MIGRPFTQSGLVPRFVVFSSPLRRDVRDNEEIRRKAQKALFDSYVYTIEYREDNEPRFDGGRSGWLNRLTGGWDKDMITPPTGSRLGSYRFKHEMVDLIETIDRTNSNPFDILWYMGTTEYRLRRSLTISYILILLLYGVFGYLGNFLGWWEPL
jgi:hypothetical protein